MKVVGLLLAPWLALAFCVGAAAPRTILFDAGQNVGRVFVADARAKAGTAPGELPHVDGIRPATAKDAPDEPTFTAAGLGLGVSLGRWAAATGSATIEPEKGRDRAICTFHRLIPFGIYSVFVGNIAHPHAALVPLDGSGLHDSFQASIRGWARLTTLTARPLTRDDVLVLVFHADGESHGRSPGNLDADAAEQLFARV